MKQIKRLSFCVFFISLNSFAMLEQISGEPIVGSMAVLESTAAIMARDRAIRDMPVATRTRPRFKIPRNISVLDQLVTDVAVYEGAQSPFVTRSPQTVSTPNFTSATLATTGFFPPDTEGAVGPEQFMTVVNGRIITNSKFTGVADGILNTTLDNFFVSVRNGATTTDPKVRFDTTSDHWFIICINETATSNRVLLAVSNDRVIVSGTIWRLFFFVQDAVSPVGDVGDFFDFPTLGIDNNALYIGGPIFTGGGSFVNSTGFVVQKKSMYGLGPLVVTAFRDLINVGGGPLVPQGVDNFDAGATQGFFISEPNNSLSSLTYRIVSNPGSTSPTISGNMSIAVTPFTFPLNVPQLGSASTLDAIDNRLSCPHIRNNQLWASQCIGTDNTGSSAGTITRDSVRWYQINMTVPTVPVVVQSGTLFDSAVSNPTFYWMPSIMSSGQGHMALGFSTCGATQFANAATVGRLSTDTLGTLGTPVLYTASANSYSPQAPGVQRWGDYSYTTLDPSDNMTLWTIQEWCNANNSYGCQVVRLLAPPPATVTLATPSSVAHGLSSVSVTITGTSVSGSGFYDPGAGFERRLTAQVGGGVIVNSITFVNATTVILNINTVYAVTGLQQVRIENPDGQQSIAAVLTIT